MLFVSSYFLKYIRAFQLPQHIVFKEKEKQINREDHIWNGPHIPLFSYWVVFISTKNIFIRLLYINYSDLYIIAIFLNLRFFLLLEEWRRA